MNKIFFTYVFACFLHNIAAAQHTDSTFFERSIVVELPDGKMDGTLSLPITSGKFPVALIIAGSGPTDRNGNSAFTKNDGLKLLGQELAEIGVATVRYDKRGVGTSAKLLKREIDIRFEDYITDAVAWIELLKKDGRFSTVTVVGHSEGSLIGMVAAKLAGANGYVSIAGGARSIAEILMEQLQRGDKDVYNLAVPIMDSLKKGMTVTKVDLRLFQYFRPTIQPYMISWLKYDPTEELKKLRVPVLLVHGTNDLQIPVDDVNRLAATKRYDELMIIQNMNHVLRQVEGDKEANAATYKDPTLPLAQGLVEGIVSFIKKKVK